MDTTTKRVLEMFLVAAISWAITRYLIRPGVRRALASR
jgi:hypothetical protein